MNCNLKYGYDVFEYIGKGFQATLKENLSNDWCVVDGEYTSRLLLLHGDSCKVWITLLNNVNVIDYNTVDRTRWFSSINIKVEIYSDYNLNLESLDIIKNNPYKYSLEFISKSNDLYIYNVIMYKMQTTNDLISLLNSISNKLKGEIHENN